ncbi:MAG: DUF4838 domain-containing protein [Planctomycetota bacterium]|nr:DUF4838 domain-containing protein [Planctomycetota bacterium]
MTQGDFKIALQGKAACVILTQPGATAAERRAADELASHLKQITGAPFDVREGGDNTPASVIIIGPGPLAQKLFPEVKLASFGGEQLTMRVKEGRMLLAGGRPRGTLYAVYRFLQEQCGVRWWAPWATRIPKHPDLAIGNLAVDETPAFESRDPYWFQAFDADWSARNACNGFNSRLDEKHGGKIVYKGFVHTFFGLVPPGEYFDKHPEWFSLIDGRRTHPEGDRHRSQLCTTNPQLRDFLVERVRQWLKESPEASIVSISQDDTFENWSGACECPGCKAVDEREGSHAGTIIELLNYVAGRLGPEFPGVAFDTLAYQYSRTPPKTVRPASNVIVRLCASGCNFAAPMEDASNKSFAEDIVGWSKISKRLYVWDYTTDFAHYVLPYPNWFSLGPNVRFFHQHNVKGLFEQGAYQSYGSEMSELRAWLLAQLLWNPDQDDRKLIDEFLGGYYGESAAGYIRRYMDLLHKAAQGFYMKCTAAPDSRYLKFDTLRQAEILWTQAEQAVKDDPDLLWRVRQGHLAARYAFLSNWVALWRECFRAGAEWPLPSSRKAVADEWLAVATGPGPEGWTPMTHVNEGGGTPQEFIARFAVDPVVSATPDLVGGQFEFQLDSSTLVTLDRNVNGMPAGTRLISTASFHDYSLAPIVDGIRNRKDLGWKECSWASEEKDAAHGIEIALAKPRRGGRLQVTWAYDVYNEAHGKWWISRDYAVQTKAKAGDAWKTVVTVKNNQTAVGSYPLSDEEIRYLRIYQLPGGGPVDRPNIMWIGQIELTDTDGK